MYELTQRSSGARQPLVTESDAQVELGIITHWTRRLGEGPAKIEAGAIRAHTYWWGYSSHMAVCYSVPCWPIYWPVSAPLMIFSVHYTRG